MQLDDGYDRTVIDLHLINNSSWKLRIIEGIGIEKVGPYAFYNSNTELKCVCTDSHLLFLESTFSIEECEKRSCCDPNPYFTYDAHEKNVNLYFQANPDDSISMTFGDGVIYDHFVDSYTYQEEGCYDITITATNPCGVQWSYTNHYNYCQDPLWQNKSNLQLKDIHFVSNDVGFGVGNKMAYKTINGGEDWVVMPIPNINESSTTLSSVYFKNETEGVILTQSFSNSSYPKLLYTTTGGLTWQDIYNEKDNINNWRSRIYRFEFM